MGCWPRRQPARQGSGARAAARHACCLGALTLCALNACTNDFSSFRFARDAATASPSDGMPSPTADARAADPRGDASDAQAGTSGGPPADAGGPATALGTAKMDGSTQVAVADAGGMDASANDASSSRMDASASADASSPMEASTMDASAMDASASMDASSPMDASAMDASASMDASSPMDAGTIQPPRDAMPEADAQLPPDTVQCLDAWSRVSVDRPSCKTCACDSCADAVLDCIARGSTGDQQLCTALFSCALEHGCHDWDCYCSSNRCYMNANAPGDGPCVGPMQDAAGGGHARVTDVHREADPDQPLVKAVRAIGCTTGTPSNSVGGAMTAQCATQCAP